MLTGYDYRENYDKAYIDKLMDKLSWLGADRVVLTGVSFDPEKTGVMIWDRGETSYYSHEKLPKNYHGTGDLFSSAFVGAYMRGKNLVAAVTIAADFVAACIRKTYEEPAHWYGVRFEAVLPELIEKLK